MLPQTFRKVVGLLLLTLLAQFSFAQNKVITGKVTDSKDGSVLAGVTVAIKGAGGRAQTGADGLYRISVPENASVLVFSYVGFASKEIAIEGKTAIDVVLVSNNSSLGEVVVVTYGTRRKSDLTGAVTAIGTRDFQKGNINSPDQLLVGKVAGLQITSGGGSPGGGSKIRIRSGASLNASNDPLIVIDGVPVESNGIAGSGNLLNTINPNDIESISVLKDASATALYGSRASNGVLIITTKKGTSGKVKFNYNTMLSVGRITNTVDVLTGDEIRSIVNADAAATGNNTYKNLLGTANTDWQKLIYQDAIGYDNNISASGTYKKVPFRVALGYLNQTGILKTDKFSRFSSSLNLSPKFLDDHLAVTLAMKYSHTANNWANQGAVGSAAAFDPTQSVTANNKYGGNFEWLQSNGIPIGTNGGSSQPNPLSLLQFRDNTSGVDRFIGSLQFDYKLHWFPDLHVMLNLGTDKTMGSGNDNIDSILVTNYQTGGRKTYYKQGKTNNLIDAFLFYTKDVKSIKGKVDVLVGHSYQDFYTDVYNYPSFSYRAIADANKPAKKDTIAGTEPTFLRDKPEYRLESYIGRMNLTLLNNYLLTASIRRDASSRFSPSTRVGYFPAVAAAWKIRDAFFKASNIVTEMKLRLGWGITGQQDGIDYYPYLPRYSQSNNSAQYQFGNTFYSFLRPAAYDANIKWETTTTSNIALDFGFLNNRISGSVDFYKKKTKDLLSVIPVAPGSNFDITLLTNVGNMENKGVELTINTTPVKNKLLTWELGANFTYNESKITNLLKQPDPNFKGIDVAGIAGGTGNTLSKFTVGYAPYTYFVYKQVYDQNNKPIDGLYEDLNRDGSVDDADRYLYKNPAPDVLLGVNTSVTYKKYSLGVAGHGSFGGYLYNNFASANGTLRNIKDPQIFIHNASASYRETGFTNNRYLSDYYIENASFFRIDNINFGYNFGKVFQNKASLRLNASVQNVAVFTKYSGLDPENASSSGVDNVIYPRPRVYSLGVNLDF